MHRFKQISKILELMHEKENIRNIGIIAHIDHGKTTLADSLLAGAGMISPTIVGDARVLDYLEEEQRRKITIKTASISLLYKSHVINLVDTPGHVDFTGKVSRAMRAIDGAVVVVDAVEGVMAQTEAVTRQALEERVKPVLFINKIDRLITEMQLSPEEIEKKLQNIVDRFNDLVEMFSEPAFREKWKVHAVRDTVAFGSALHGWGFTFSIAKMNDIKFSDILDAYKSNRHEKLQEKLPVYASVFSMAIYNLPNPREAQEYRMETIWDGHPDSEMGRMLSGCDDEALAALCVTNVKAEPEGNTIVTGLLFSGRIKKGDKLHLIDAQTDATVERVYLPMGALKEEVAEIPSGNILALEISGKVKCGETLVDPSHKDVMIPFESLGYISEAVLTVAIEPKDPKDLPLLREALHKMSFEDPNLAIDTDEETGEYLLKGLGELHLEIALKQLNSDLAITASPPRTVYRESVTCNGTEALARSPNKHNVFVVQVGPLKEGADDSGNVLSIDEHRNVLLDSSGKTDPIEETALESIIAGFEFACKAGPLCGEPVRHVKTKLTDLKLSENESLRSSKELMRGVSKAIFGSFLAAKPVLLEPIYRTQISAPIEQASECQRIVGIRRGKILSFEVKGTFASIVASVPVAESTNLARDLRSATSGRAFWQSALESWEQMPAKLAYSVIGEIRKRKGLAPGIPKPERFLGEQ
jgi:elongation factor 2